MPDKSIPKRFFISLAKGLLATLLLTALLSSPLLTTSCASRGNPSGGLKDTLAPQIDTTFPPNYSLHFKAEKIEIELDEYISLKGANQQIRINPPLEQKLKIEAGLKSFSIELNPDSLAPNTTYTITFGQAITDFTEGNVNDRFKYVFSTGDFIDSLSLAGIVRDTEGKVVENITVALYDLERYAGRDSLPYTALPSYYTITDESGRYVLSNLKYGDFALVAFEDKSGKFQLSTGRERIAFVADTIHLDPETPQQNLLLFKPDAKARLVNARQVDLGKIRLAFEGDTRGVQVEDLPWSLQKKANEALVQGRGSDTLYYWYEGATDSIRLRISLESEYSDTVVVPLRSEEPIPTKLNLRSADLLKGDSLWLDVNQPIKSLNLSALSFRTAADTIASPEAGFSAEEPYAFYVLPPKGEKGTLILAPGAVLAWTSALKDSLKLDYNFLAGDDLGSADFKVVADSSRSYILELSGPGGKLMHRATFVGSYTVRLKNVKAEKYSARLILDDDGNGKWSSGDYLARRQPERILLYENALEIRGNWNVEVEWLVPEDQLRNSN